MRMGGDMSDLIKQVGGIDKIKKIVENAPGRAEVCIPCLEDVMYFAKRDDGKWFKWSNGYNQWLEYFGKVDPMDLALDLNDLRQAIADYNTDDCKDIQNHISPSTKVYDK